MGKKMLLEKIKNYKIFLASQSPRRYELLKNMDIDFELAPKIFVDESYSPDKKKCEIPVYLSQKKAEAYSQILDTPEKLIITADTIVLLDEQVLEKPDNQTDAAKMLRRLSGKKHSVITGMTLKTSTKQKSFEAVTYVWFKDFSEEEIDYYVKNYKPLDKAGAYGIQEWIGLVGVEKIEGSYFNVVGLPVHKLYAELNSFLEN